MPLASRSTRLENGAETGEMEWPSGWQWVHKGDSSLVFGILIVATNHFWFLCFQCNFPVPKSVTARPGVHLWLSRWNQLLLWYCLSWIFFLPVVLDPQKKKLTSKSETFAKARWISVCDIYLFCMLKVHTWDLTLLFSFANRSESVSAVWTMFDLFSPAWRWVRKDAQRSHTMLPMVLG